MNSLERLTEHIKLANTALTNVGADGIYRLERHLRLSIEWAYNLEIEATSGILPETEKARYTALARSVQLLNSSLVTRIPEQVAAIQETIKGLPATLKV
jgi:predicted GNAT superfamily acetyltransferase